MLYIELGIYGGVVLLFVIFAIAAPLIAPNNPTEPHLNSVLQSSSSQFPLGTDRLGRCILSRIIYGSRITVIVAACVLSASVFIGVAIGVLSGLCGGIIDSILMRITDTFLAFPGILLALAIVSFSGGGALGVIIALTAMEWVKYARLVRGCILDLKERDFIVAAEGLGTGRMRIITHYYLPSIIMKIVPLISLSVAGIVLATSGFSFIGIGIEPSIPEWGLMIAESKDYIRSAPLMIVYPGIALFLFVMALNLLGDLLERFRERPAYYQSIE